MHQTAGDMPMHGMKGRSTHPAAVGSTVNLLACFMLMQLRPASFPGVHVHELAEAAGVMQTFHA